MEGCRKRILAVFLVQWLFTIASADPIYLYAGMYGSSGTPAGDGGPATSARFNTPKYNWINTLGSMFLSENNRIRKIDASGIVSTIFGTGSSTSSADGFKATSAGGSILCSYGDTAGNVYYNDGGYKIRKIDAVTSTISTVAGGGSVSLTDNMKATAASLFSATHFTDSVGNLYLFGQTSDKIQKVIVSSGIIMTFAGSSSYSVDGGDGGPATSAYLPYVFSGTISGPIMYTTSSEECAIRAINMVSGKVTTVAGQVGAEFVTASGDGGPATAALIRADDSFVSVDDQGSLYYETAYYGNIRKVDTAGIINNYAGKDNAYGYSGNGGEATAAVLKFPYGLAWYNGANYIVEKDANTARVIARPTVAPTASPTTPTVAPTAAPTELPTVIPTAVPSVMPSVQPTAVPTVTPTQAPTILPSIAPTWVPTLTMPPTEIPTEAPTMLPSVVPTTEPSEIPTVQPTQRPSVVPSVEPSQAPTVLPSRTPTLTPTVQPSTAPTMAPTVGPTIAPTVTPSMLPTVVPSALPSVQPSVAPTVIPTLSMVPTEVPTESPSVVPSVAPSMQPSEHPTTLAPSGPSGKPTKAPTVKPTRSPTVAPTLPSLTLTFNSSIYLHNVSSNNILRQRRLTAGEVTLDASSESAVTSAVALTLRIDEDQVMFLHQQYIGPDPGVDHYQVLVVVNVMASTRDFNDSVNQNATFLYNKLSSTLTAAVVSNAFSATLRSVSAALNAADTLYVGQVNVTVSDYSVIPFVSAGGDVNGDSKSGFSSGAIVGIVIGGVAFLVLMVFMVCYCIRKSSKKYQKVVVVAHTADTKTKDDVVAFDSNDV